MAERELPPVARLFTKRRSPGTRLTGALAVTLAFGVVAFGIATAIYLERPMVPRLAPAVTALLSLPAQEPAAAPPIAESPAIESPPAESPPAETAAAVEPQAGTSAPQSMAALEPAPAPTLAPTLPAAPKAAAARYWVEYGVFVNQAYAHRLQQHLSRQGLDAVIVATHGRDGRKLLRVRSAALADLATARKAADAARQTLHLATLLHRGAPDAAPEGRYRVRFAAFARPEPAARLSRTLTRHGIAATVSVARGPSGKPLYFVQSAPVRDRAQALALGARGRPLVHSDFLIERRVAHVAGHRQAPRPPPHAVAASG